jgi:hypothetical protein
MTSIDPLITPFAPDGPWSVTTRQPQCFLFCLFYQVKHQGAPVTETTTPLTRSDVRTNVSRFPYYGDRQHEISPTFTRTIMAHDCGDFIVVIRASEQACRTGRAQLEPAKTLYVGAAPPHKGKTQLA